MGNITSADGLISCGTQGTACSVSYAWTAQVVLTATANAGYMFGTWVGDCSGNGICTLDTSRSGADKFVGATFGQAGVALHPNFVAATTHGPAYFATLAGTPGSYNCSATQCHGPTLDGVGIAPSCNACHQMAGWTAWRTNCSFCHGTKNATSQAGYDVTAHPELAAPPDDVATRLGGTPTGATGAHQAHLLPSTFSNGVACSECHTVPTSVAHVNGVDDVAFGAVATTRGAAPTWTAGTLSCASTYCHGNFRGGNGTAAIAWSGSAPLTCESCHGNPPLATHAAGVTACSSCHDGYGDKGPGQFVNGATHVNGVVDVAAMGCTSCHGDSARTPAPGQDPMIAAAPPFGTNGETATTQPAVGAHQAHLTAGALSGALACTDCHALPTSTSHANGAATFTWSDLATGRTSAIGNGAAPVFSAASLTCASTYCHGSFTNGTAGNAPVWTAGGAGATCGSCHGLPPGGTHPATAQDCGACHPGYSTTTVDPLLHVNGIPDYSMSCTSCHSGPLGGSDANGVALAAAPDVGAHRIHLAGSAVRSALPCASCHAVPTTYAHSTAPLDLTFGTLARTGGATPSTSGTGTSISCANYCHGSTLVGGPALSGAWNTGGTTCSSCHGFPPQNGVHSGVAAAATACNACHPSTVTAAGAIDVAGGRHVNGAIDVVNMTCTTCHGDPARTPAAGQDAQVAAAPPRGTHGETLTSQAAVGAHQAHLTAGALSGALACSSCHAVPTSTSHATGTVTFAWSNLATGAGSGLGTGTTPTFSTTALTCASTYCHGNFRNGNAAAAPVWTAGSAGAACGSCHGLPPAGTHPVTTRDCGACHPGYTTTTVNAALHVNGAADTSMTCTSCHSGSLGGSDANGVALAAAPDVGAHAVHLAGGTVRAALPCASCHVVPTTSAHSTAPLDLTFGTLARSGGATPSTTGTGTSISCANYCHGSTLVGGPAASAAWSTTGTTCSSCHGFPPQNGVHSGVAAAATACNACHPSTVTAAGAIDVAGGRHVDGNIDVINLTCTTCHGDPARTPGAGQDAQIAAAPPLGTRGETATTQAAVGAHQAHLTAGALSGALACADCHAVPTSTSHATGTLAFAWSPLATGTTSAIGTGATPVFSATALTCASTYCHGNFTNGATANAPVWTAGAAGATCGSCHGLPPAGTHPATARDCGSCHPGYTSTTVNPLAHVNGIPDYSMTCTSCHSGSLTGSDANAVSLAAAPDVGAHAVHLAGGTVRAALPCASCHVVPTTSAHSNAPLDLTFGTLARARGATPSTTGTGTSISCANYCHGSTLVGGPAASGAWNTTGTTCGSCHGFPPQNGVHSGVAAAATACNACHPSTVTAAGAIDVAGGRHVDGNIDVINLTCTTCHGDPARTPAAGQDAQIAAAPPRGTGGETLPSQAAVGAHQAHLTAGTLSRALACADCHAVPTSTSHATGTISFAWSPLATGTTSPIGTGATPVFSSTALTCASTYCHGAFRNGTAANAPVWTAGGAGATCGSCHGLPPGGTHPVTTRDCGVCHPGYTTTSVNATLHVNGAADTSMTCTSCHSGALTGSDANGVALAPAPDVGAHAVHLAGGTVRAALPCASCHVVPTTSAHSTAPLDLTFGTLARSRGATPSTTGTGTSISCANYCHGSTLVGGPAASGAWNTTGTTCGSCHGFPPQNGVHSGVAAAATACNACHPSTVTAAGAIDVAGGRHVDGNIDVINLTCTTCHGDPARTPAAGQDAQIAAAPPKGTGGETLTSQAAVGAHQAHLTAGTLSRALACADCHAVPTSTSHATGTISFAWSPLATGTTSPIGTGATPVFSSTALTCASTYCHGSFTNGATTNAPVWTAGSAGAACGSCHGLPPAGTHPTTTRDCGVCHPGYTTTSVNATLHVNGAADTSMTCASCHSGPLTGSDANGVALAPAPDVGAHVVHLSGGTVRAALPCASCHVVPTTSAHSTAPLDLTFGTLARSGGATPSTTGTGTSISCANYCHGSTLVGGPTASRAWNTTGTTCGSCHGFPPANGVHSSVAAAATACNACHPSTVTAAGAIDVAGGHHVDGRLDVINLTCTTCHGDPARTPAAGQDAQIAAAPPLGTRGETATTQAAVGAHQAHLTAGLLSGALACSDCHALPTSTSHATGSIAFAWSPLATGTTSAIGTGATPVFSSTALTCASTYCHGNFTNGATANAPVWTAGSAGATCGSCHGLPPAGTHPATARDCGSCHPGYTSTTVNPLAHVNGIPDYSMTCTSCHSGPLTGSDANAVSLAPAPDVGAHVVHLSGGTVRAALPCASCHVVPTTSAHSNAPLDLTFGTLARSGGATPSTTGTGTSISCANYCHGSTLVGGPAASAAWSTTGTTCGSCHGFPPQNGVHSGVAAAASACNRCHPATVTAAGAIDVAGGHHVDGTIDVINLTCTTCHGDPARTVAAGQDAQIAAAPPMGVDGETLTSQAAVGAHQAHLTAGLLSGALACADCHAVPTSTSHATGTLAFAWSPLATGTTSAIGTGATPVFSATALTCASTYCHGNFTNGATANAPVWTAGAAGATCGSCHGLPPAGTHPATARDCGSCHPGYTSTTVNPLAHVNGIPDYSMTCTSCHSGALTGSDANGVALAPAPEVGAHRVHLAGSAVRGALPCASCHVVPTTSAHSNAPLDLTFGALARTGGATPSTTGTGTSISCANYCHGSTLVGGPATSTAWNTTGTTCGSCHGFPPQNGVHSGVTAAATACNNCHPATVTAAGAIDLAGGHHVDGNVDVITLTCTTCHGDPARTPGAGQDPAIADAPPRGTHGETATTDAAVGAHQAHLTAGTLAGALACSDCHAVPTSTSHATGTVAFSWSGLASGSSSALGTGGTPVFSTTALTCASTYCHGAFRNGTAANAPVWTAGGAGATCGSCHGLPPGGTHPVTLRDCGACHPGYTATTVDPLSHVNGIPEYSMSCTSCHSGPLTGTDANNVSLAIAPSVGAHGVHLQGSTIAAALACSACHVVPADTAHSTQPLDLTFGALARTNGAAVTVAGTGTQTTCANYCHGATMPGGPFTSPTWGTAGTTCTSCHGNPPALPHPQNSGCAECHGTGYSSSTVVAATHVNGTVNLVPAHAATTCARCHGDSTDATRGADPTIAAAPPAGTRGETATSARAVGAHRSHLLQTTFRRNPITCDACHTVPGATDTAHANGTAALAFDALARTGGVTPTFDGARCNTVYCHGGTSAVQGGSATQPTWTGTFTAGATTLGCGSCHGAPPPGHTSSDCGSCHPGYTATSVNPDRHIDGTVDIDPSGARVGCEQCHAAIKTAMLDATPATSTYHHVMASNVVLQNGDTYYPNNPTPGPTQDAYKTCAMCHVAHARFPSAGANLRDSIDTYAPPVASNADSTLCLSCHDSAQVKDKARQRTDGTAGTPAIAATDFAGSAHTFAVAGQFGTSAFSVSCTKCHSSSATQYQSGAFRFALHESQDRRLLNPLGLTPADNLEERFCFRCHSHATDSNPGGAAAKAADGLDYFGAATMAADSEDLFTRFNGIGTVSTPSTTTNRLYFRSVATANAVRPGNRPAAWLLASGTYNGVTWAASRQLDLAPTTGTTANLTTAGGNVGARYVHAYQFVSPPVAAAASISSGTITLALTRSASSTTYAVYDRVQVYARNAAGTTTTALGAVVRSATNLTTTSTTVTLSYPVTTAANLAVGDYLVVELEYYVTTAPGTSGNLTNAVNTATQALTLPVAIAFQTGAAATKVGHNVAAYTGLHRPNPAEETRAYLSANKHVACGDCHDPHAAGKTRHPAPDSTPTPARTATNNLVSGVLNGATGVTPTWATANWTAPTAYTDPARLTPTTGREYQICFKCHSGANTALATWNSGWTDVGRDFSPANKSYHPVVQALPQTAGTTGSVKLGGTKNWVNGWGGGMTMWCTDCHGGETTAASFGPHGSANSFMLRGYWPKDGSGAYLSYTGSMPTGTLCAMCHGTLGVPHTSDTAHRTQCVKCHIVVPHGGKVSRLIGAIGQGVSSGCGNIPAPYCDTAMPSVIQGFVRSTTGSYNRSNCAASCSTGDHPWYTTSSPESW